MPRLMVSAGTVGTRGARSDREARAHGRGVHLGTAASRSHSAALATRGAVAARERREAAHRRSVLGLAFAAVILVFIFLFWQVGWL